MKRHALFSWTLALACSRGEQPPPPARIDGVAPVELTAAAKVTLRGESFAAENDVALAPRGGAAVGYVNGARSSDGKTLTFDMPYALGACAMTQLKPEAACPSIAIAPKNGEAEIWVIHRGGESNRWPVTIAVQDVGR
jgi:hypothetical protein